VIGSPRARAALAGERSRHQTWRSCIGSSRSCVHITPKKQPESGRPAPGHCATAPRSALALCSPPGSGISSEPSMGHAFVRTYKNTWHLDEMVVASRGEPYLLWRADDKHGAELHTLQRKAERQSHGQTRQQPAIEEQGVAASAPAELTSSTSWPAIELGRAPG
jgi:hypothetical protein